jgi:hypothetical protein
MPYLVAAVVLLGVLCIVNLLFTLGILRRLRTHTTWTPDPMFALSPGSTVGEFSATTTTGEPVSSASLAGLVGFFSAGCEACHEVLPHFTERATQMPHGSVLAVVGGDDEETVRALTSVARVVVADLDGGPVARAFQNKWTPALYLLDDNHRVISAGVRMDELLTHAVSAEQ